VAAADTRDLDLRAEREHDGRASVLRSRLPITGAAFVVAGRRPMTPGS